MSVGHVAVRRLLGGEDAALPARGARGAVGRLRHGRPAALGRDLRGPPSWVGPATGQDRVQSFEEDLTLMVGRGSGVRIGDLPGWLP